MASCLRQDLKCFFHEAWYVLNNFGKLREGGNLTISFKKHFQRLRHLLKHSPKDYLDKVFIQKSC